jgi:hypothetical protein
MKKIITIALFFLPFFGFSQTVTKADTLVKKVVTVVKQVVVVDDENALSDEYTERPFQGKEEVKSKNPYNGLTDEEIYYIKLKQKTKKKVGTK